MGVFEDMDENLFRQLYPKMEVVQLDPGAPLYRMGDDDTAAFFVKTGSVGLSSFWLCSFCFVWMGGIPRTQR